MPTTRKIVFVNDNYYHIFNRGIDKRITFSNTREYTRAMELLNFYQYNTIPLRFSHYSRLPAKQQNYYMDLMTDSGKKVEIVAYCLMPNHFHLLLKQISYKGITTFVANFINAYTKYFNTKYNRTGSLFQGIFKAVFVDTEEYLLHLTRYIHLNPVVASIIEEKDLYKYKWSSYSAYLSSASDNLINQDTKRSIVPQTMDYEKFVLEQIPYAKKLHQIKHLLIE